MVDKLDQNAGLYTLADRDEPEQDILHRGSILATAQSEVQIPGKHTGTKHKMCRQQFCVDRRLHQLLQLRVIGLDFNTVADLIEDGFVLREILGVLTRMQLLAQTLELFRTECKAFVFLDMFKQTQKFTALCSCKAAETRCLGKAHILPAHSSGKAQHIGSALEIQEAFLGFPVGTMDDIGYIQCKVLLTRNILILHQRHYLIQKLLATVREKHLYGILLIRRKRGFARYALNKIPVDFILGASWNLLGCGKVVSIKTLAESGRVRVGGPCPTAQIVEVVDDIQLHKARFHRIVREIRPDGRSL